MENKDYTVYFAKTNFRGSDRTFGIRTPDRRQHTYIVGKTGTGKTNLLKNLAFQDIESGGGIAIVDPHGGFVEEVLEKIPRHRINDVIYFNPADSEYPIGFNVLEVPDPKYKHLVASDLIGIFTKIWANVWSARMEYILNNCILALIDTPGTTLLGISRILVDKDYRRQIIENVKDPVVRSFWVQEYEGWQDRYRSEAIAPIQNKVGQFLSTTMVRNIVGQPTSSLNIYQIMNEGKILLVDVAKGRIGEDNAALLGAMIITKIQLAAMERVRIPEEERKDFFLYVDEFQNFATDSFANILSEARKYRLNIVIAHQYIGQLVTDTTTKVRDAVFGNVGTMIVFRVGAADAEFLEKEFEPEFEIQDLVNLPNYHIYLKLMVNGITSRPFSALTIPAIGPAEGTSTTDELVALSREKYARPRAKVEEDIQRWSGMFVDDDTPPKGKEEKFSAICSSCGKSTEVSFKPDGKRPVYCLACLKKVQAGKIPAVDTDIPKAQFDESLSSLGIEFAGGKQEVHREQRRPEERPQQRKSPPPVRASEPVLKTTPPAKSMSLSELSRPRFQERKGPNFDGLKMALKDALGGAHTATGTGLNPQQKTPPENSRVIKPGEAVKL